MSNKLPSIPDPGNSTPSIVASILAMRDSLRRIASNALDTTGSKESIFVTNAYLNKRLATLTVVSNTNTNQIKTVKSTADSAQSQANSLNGDLTSLSSQVGSVADQANTTQNNLTNLKTVKYGLDGYVDHANFVAQKVVIATGDSWFLSIPTASIAVDAITLRDSGSSAGASATATLVLPAPADVLVLAAFTGPQVATPGGTGLLIVHVDGADTTITHVPVTGGDALPCSGAHLFNNLTKASHTFTVRAEFTTGPTSLNGVSVIAIALLR